MRLTLAAAVALLVFATQADAKVYELANFKVLSVSGSRAVTFTEDSGFSSGARCTGTTSARVDFRTTTPVTVYMNVRRIHGRRKIVVSDKAKPPQQQYQLVEGVATVSRTVDYQATGGCRDEPTACPATTVPATVNLFGTDDHDHGVGVEAFDFEAGPGCDLLLSPWGSRLESQSAFADVFSWSELFDAKRKRLEGSNRIEEPLTGDDSTSGATVSGLRTDETSIVMKRLKLEEELKDRR